MGKILVLLILALGAGLYFPSSRERILDYAEPLLMPALRWTTQQELERIAEDLEIEQGSRGMIPSGRGEFDPWLDDRYRQEPSRFDAWGGRYALKVVGDSFRVISAGPDRLPDSEDDLVESRRLAPRPGSR
jgi:hypothetical protein